MKKLFSLFAALLLAGGVFAAGRSFAAGEVLYQRTAAVNWWNNGGAVIRAIFDSNDTIIGVAQTDGEHTAFTIPAAKTYSTVVLDRAASATAAAWNATKAISLEGTTLNSIESFAENSATVTWGTFDPSVVVVPDYYIKHPFGGGNNWAWKKLTREGETDIHSLRDIYGGTGCNWKAGETGAETWVGSPTLVGAPVSGDSAIFALNAATKTITITKISGEGPEPVVTYDTVMCVAGNFTNWAADMKPIPYSITLPADSALEFKLVRKVTTLRDGEPSGTPVLTWYGQMTEGYQMTRENIGTGWTLDGEANVKLTTDAEGEYTFSLNGTNFMVTFPELPVTGCDWDALPFLGDGAKGGALTNKYKMCVPAESGISVVNIQNAPWDNNNDGIYISCPSADRIACGLADGQYGIQGAGILLHLSAFTAKYTDFTISYGGNDYDCSVYYVDGTDEPVVNYYLIGSFTNNWDLSKALPMEGDSIVKNFAAGTYTFKVITPEIISGEDTNWTTALGYADVNADCSSEGYEAGGTDVKITLAEAGDVKVKVAEGAICLTGSFGEVVISSWTIVGDSALVGAMWLTTAVENDMNNNEGTWTLTKSNVALGADTYNYKVVANHDYAVGQYPALGNMELVVETAGLYNVTFTWVPAEESLTAVVTPSHTTALENVTEGVVTKKMENGQLVIIKNGVRYNAVGAKL